MEAPGSAAQLNVTPLVEEEPFSVAVGLPHVMETSVPAFAFGIVKFVLTTTVSVATQVENKGLCTYIT